MESNLGRQGLSAACILLYSWVLGTPLFLIIATRATHEDIWVAWVVLGVGLMASLILTLVTLLLPFYKDYKRALLDTQPNAIALAIVLCFAWTLLIVNFLEVVVLGPRRLYTWFGETTDWW